MDKPIAHAIFPTLIYTNLLKDRIWINELLEQNLDPYLFDREQGIQGEYIGLADMHLVDDLKKFYSIIADNTRLYANTLGIDIDLFDIYIVKSTISKISHPNDHFFPHRHASSDVSFIYYFKVPENGDSLLIHDRNRANEIIDAVFDRDRERLLIREDNSFNKIMHAIEPQPGLLVLFPGKTLHSTANTTGIPAVGDRIAIVGDINLVLKSDQNNWEMGKVSLDKWRAF